MSMENLACSCGFLGQNAQFSTSFSIYLLFHSVHIGSFFSQIWLHPHLQANRLARKTALISWGEIEKVRREAQQLNSGSWKNNLKVVSAQSITYRQVITIHFCRSQPSVYFTLRESRAGGEESVSKSIMPLQWEAVYLKMSSDTNRGAGRRGLQASPPIPVFFLNSLLRREDEWKRGMLRRGTTWSWPAWNDNTNDREWKYSIVYPTRLFFCICWKLRQWQCSTVFIQVCQNLLNACTVLWKQSTHFSKVSLLPREANTCVSVARYSHCMAEGWCPSRNDYECLVMKAQRILSVCMASHTALLDWLWGMYGNP